MKQICCTTYKYVPFFIICIFIFCSFFTNTLVFNTNNTHADWINSYTINETTDSIIVVLDESISAINKTHNKDIFAGVEIQSIIDLTHSDNPQNNKDKIFRQILQIFLKDSSPKKIINAMSTLSKLDYIKSVEPNTPLEITSTIDELATNNPNTSELWNLFGEYGINIGKTWDFTIGSKNIRVGIIDSGVASHIDLNYNLTNGWDYYTESSITSDDPSGHGTHVAGIIGATANNSEGIMGINWNISLVPLQILNVDTGLVNIPAAIKAINDAKSFYGTENQIDILNYSVAGFGETPSVREAVREYQGLFVCSAGNKNENVDLKIPTYGSFDLPNLISVGAINEDGTRRSNSSYGQNSVSIYAPGTNILSTMPNNTYTSSGGTSMAAPHVAGVAALLLSYNPNLTAAQLKTAIINGADTITIEVPDGDDEDTLPDTQTVKKLNATKALQYVMDCFGDTATIKFNSSTFSKSVNANSDFFEESNFMLKMDVQNDYTYSFSLSSTSALVVALYDANLNEIPISTVNSNRGKQVDFSKYLTEGKYYLQTSYLSATVTGTISATIIGEAHDHDHTYRYEQGNARNHRAYCICGDYQLKPHVVRVGINGPENRCAICGALVASGGNLNGLQSTARYVTANGSFIAANGVIYLVDEDFDAYFEGTLQFYLNTDLPLLTNTVAIYGEGLFPN